jgi:hypothetical protein
MANHTGRMILTTANPTDCPDGVSVIAALASVGFIGERLDGQVDHAFCVGPAFLSLVSFAGCAVRIETTPNPHAPFCHLRCPPLAPFPRLYCGRNTRPPRCMDCRGRLDDWRERVDDWTTQPCRGVTCPGCGATRLPWQWDWKEQGGFGRWVILVEEVFPGEAAPTQSLLDLLADASGTRWRHFYVRD